MKKIILAAVMAMMGACIMYSQNITRKGNEFTQANNNRTKTDTLVTKYTYNIGSASYPIIVNKFSGRCYIWRLSKNGNLYRMYLKEDVCRTICKELNINYKEKKGGKK